ncbi:MULTISPECIES: 1-propanol dehydrogenase PduQ [Bacillota]|nr:MULTISPECIES: 1-propanol dehydrogenase PduQ [Bacillota]MEB5456453.1 1-propanol dehydrogenase PduQ [Virgibacillus pantothenticus]MED3736726.1 iron-containing alcohol dehydrogenase [Virgibacillus pantothenticus]
MLFDVKTQDFLRTCQGNRYFIISDPMMKELGFIEIIKNEILQQNNSCKVFDKITPDPQLSTVAEGLHEMMTFKPDVLIAIGGGSAIDAAKGMILSFSKIDRDAKRPLFIAIPSTSGTGSEVTSFAVITNGLEKKPIINEVMIPDIALLDVDLVKTVPPKVTADTGMDVLTHAIEAYVSTKATEFTDALAEKAIKLVFESLIEVFRDGSKIEHRNKMHKASSLAGIAFTNASLGISHSIAHAIGGIFHISHGRINALILPHVIAYNAGCDGKLTPTANKYQEISQFLNLPAATPEEGTKSLISAINFLNEALTIEKGFSELAIEKDNYYEYKHLIADFALQDDCTTTNPRVPTREELAGLYLSLY